MRPAAQHHITNCVVAYIKGHVNCSSGSLIGLIEIGNRVTVSSVLTENLRSDALCEYWNGIFIGVQAAIMVAMGIDEPRSQR